MMGVATRTRSVLTQQVTPTFNELCFLELDELERKAKAYYRLQAIYGGTIHVDGKSVTIKDFLEGKDV